MEQTSLNIGSIGQKLEAARQLKGVTVSEAGHATKILAKVIEAMESDDFGSLSAPVYAKSFIKMYAKYLGIDSRPLVDEYIKLHAPKGTAHLADEVRQSFAKSEQVSIETTAMPVPSKHEGKKVFSSVGNAHADGGIGGGFPVKMVSSAVVGILLVGVAAATVTQCSSDEDEAPAPAGGAAMVERALISEGVPDAYLVEPGKISVDK